MALDNHSHWPVISPLLFWFTMKQWMTLLNFLRLNSCFGPTSGSSSRLLHYIINCRHIIASAKSPSVHSRLEQLVCISSCKTNVAAANTSPHCLFTKVSTDKPSRCKKLIKTVSIINGRTFQKYLRLTISETRKLSHKITQVFNSVPVHTMLSASRFHLRLLLISNLWVVRVARNSNVENT